MPHLYASMAIANRTPIRWSSWRILLRLNGQASSLRGNFFRPVGDFGE
jgi:hypothetical protein